MSSRGSFLPSRSCANGVFILVKPQAPHDAAESGMAGAGAVVLRPQLVPYGTLWAERYAQIDAKLEDPTVSYIDDPEDGSFYHVSSYDIKLKRSQTMNFA